MRNLTPIRNFSSVLDCAIENMLSIGLIIRDGDFYYLDDNVRDSIKDSGGNLLKRKVEHAVDDNSGMSKKFRLEDETEEQESNDDEKVVVSLKNLLISVYLLRL